MIARGVYTYQPLRVAAGLNKSSRRILMMLVAFGAPRCISAWFVHQGVSGKVLLDCEAI
jgi:hypothetical protein